VIQIVFNLNLVGLIDSSAHAFKGSGNLIMSSVVRYCLNVHLFAVWTQQLFHFWITCFESQESFSLLNELEGNTNEQAEKRVLFSVKFVNFQFSNFVVEKVKHH
jgi:hypothetical protein